MASVAVESNGDGPYAAGRAVPCCTPSGPHEMPLVPCWIIEGEHQVEVMRRTDLLQRCGESERSDARGIDETNPKRNFIPMPWSDC